MIECAPMIMGAKWTMDHGPWNTDHGPFVFSDPNYCFGGPSPSPEEPTNNFLPSVNVMMLPLALLEPSFAWNPSTRISVPGSNEVLFQPRRSRALGAAASTAQRGAFPSSPLTSSWIPASGL